MVSNKSRLLRLYRYLYVNTDDRHFTTKAEIMKALKDQETIYSRQTVRDDIDTLAKEGYDIETIVSSGNYYYFGDREFTLEELRLMADAVASSRFIGRKQKAAIQKKLKGFCSRFQAETVERHLVSVEPIENSDPQTYAMVNLINDAINEGRKISFQIGEPGIGKRKKLIDGGETFTCTPLDIAWDGRNFHLVALADPAQEPELYAVSSLVKPVILEEKGAAKPKGFKSDHFAADKLRLS